MRTKIKQVIGGIQYDTEKAEVIASNEYWDGHNWERRGRNIHLYRSPKNRYFEAFSSQWAGERDYVKPLSKEEAKNLYESLPEHEVSYQEAFGEAPEEA